MIEGIYFIQRSCKGEAYDMSGPIQKYEAACKLADRIKPHCDDCVTDIVLEIREYDKRQHLTHRTFWKFVDETD